jgi:hypothetical protein
MSAPASGAGGNRFIVAPPPKDEAVYNGKRMRKAILRRGVDYNAPMLNWNKKSKFHKDLFDDDFVQWDLDEPETVEERSASHPLGAKHFLPPSAQEHL